MNLIIRDLKHIWHPCSQMKDFEQCPPLVVNKANGCYLYTENGPVIDAISSWWCKSLGHANPAIIHAIQNQLQLFEHVISANTTHSQMVELAEALTLITQKQHLFFASDGSSAVEIAMKLALHANLIKGHGERKNFAALENSYHGETLGALSVSDVERFKQPYQGFGVHCHFINEIPYVTSSHDPLWNSCELAWKKIELKLEAIKETLCAIIVEPIVQGGGGMRLYSADFLKKLAFWAKKNDIYLIADEIMTGLGRTGHWLACEHAEVEADMVCLSKGLTGGTVPMSCVLIDSNIYELFYADYSEGKSFLHSHTYSGNALGISAALATIKYLNTHQLIPKAKILGEQMHRIFQEIASITGKLTNIRSLGAWAAADLQESRHQRIGFKLYQEALKRGALLRPLGKTLYWLPPLTIDEEIIGNLAEITLNSIQAAYI